jgi:hypothetical protein
MEALKNDKDLLEVFGSDADAIIFNRKLVPGLGFGACYADQRRNTLPVIFYTITNKVLKNLP